MSYISPIKYFIHYDSLEAIAAARIGDLFCKDRLSCLYREGRGNELLLWLAMGGNYYTSKHTWF